MNRMGEFFTWFLAGMTAAGTTAFSVLRAVIVATTLLGALAPVTTGEPRAKPGLHCESRKGWLVLSGDHRRK